MPQRDVSEVLPTISRALLEDWLSVLRRDCAQAQVEGFLRKAGLPVHAAPQARVTHDQIVRFYQLVAQGTADEMKGLWSRPIRSGALKHLCTSVRGASSLSAALFRFTTFWNLLLDDFELSMETRQGAAQIFVSPLGPQRPDRFGHMLMLKLAHGIASWLTGRELPLQDVHFGFDRPEFAGDYAVLFPTPVLFGRAQSSIVFAEGLGDLPVTRSDAEMQAFLQRAPRDWIFTSYREHALPLKVREFLLLSERLDAGLAITAEHMNMTGRTLIRRLESEGTSFQAIKDGLRRDIAMQELQLGQKSIEAISQDIGFASAANFHRAFKRWTGATPGAVRRS